MPDKEEQSIKELLDNYAKNLEELQEDEDDKHHEIDVKHLYLLY